MKKYSLLALLALLSSGCTISLSLVDTHGTAEDVIDSEAKTQAEVDPTLSIPAIGL